MSQKKLSALNLVCLPAILISSSLFTTSKVSAQPSLASSSAEVMATPSTALHLDLSDALQVVASEGQDSGRMSGVIIQGGSKPIKIPTPRGPGGGTTEPEEAITPQTVSDTLSQEFSTGY